MALARQCTGVLIVIAAKDVDGGMNFETYLSMMGDWGRYRVLYWTMVHDIVWSSAHACSSAVLERMALVSAVAIAGGTSYMKPWCATLGALSC